MSKLLNIRSFRMKLLFMIWIGSTATLFLACGGFIFFEVAEFNKDLAKDMKILSSFIADKSTSAIMLNDPAIAEDALFSAAAVDTAILRAAVYDTESKVVAAYMRNISRHKDFDMPELQRNTSFIKGGSLHLFTDIIMYSDRVGSVYIEADRHILYERLQSYGIITAGIMAVSLLFLVPISFLLQKNISRPVMALIASAKHVSEIKDYSVRVKKQSDDELGILSDAFNEMLSQIQERESALLKSEKKHRGLTENLPQRIFHKDVNLVYVSCNKHYAQDLGITPDEIAGKTDFNFYPKEMAEKYRADDRRLMESGHTEEIEEVYIKNGREMFVQTVKTPLSDDAGNVIGILGIFWDITERKKLEEEKQKIHKLESIGILAGGIAHDFNNLLSIILNNVYMAKMKVDNKSNAYGNITEIEKAMQRATDLTQQLLTFSRGGAPVKKTASIIEIIEGSAEFVLRGSNVKCEYNITENLWSVEVDKGQINQVIHNLILNADQSMPEGGTIRIYAENFDLGSGTGLPLKEGRYIKVVVRDQGTGISEEHLKKLFDPYFTTKELGRGLGLSITYSIIKQHDGHISAESELGVGTTFTIYLPASEKQVDETKVAADALAAGEGKILLMDDEEMIIKSLGEFLIMTGYKVEYAKDGEEAIELYEKAMKASEPFDAVILDLTIRGGMGGKEVVKKLLETNPDVKTIVSSGYSNDPVMANYKEYGFSDVFCKASNSPDDLCRILNKVIKE